MSVPFISKEVLSTLGMPPMSNSPHALVTTANVSNNSQNLANFENLLPRSPYIPPDVNNTMASGNAANSLNSSSLQPPPPPPRSSAPPAHQSPKQVGKIVNTLLSTLLSGINIGPTLINFGYFSRPYSLIKGLTFIKFWDFSQSLQIFSSLMGFL